MAHHQIYRPGAQRVPEGRAWLRLKGEMGSWRLAIPSWSSRRVGWQLALSLGSTRDGPGSTARPRCRRGSTKDGILQAGHRVECLLPSAGTATPRLLTHSTVHA